MTFSFIISSLLLNPSSKFLISDNVLFNSRICLVHFRFSFFWWKFYIWKFPLWPYFSFKLLNIFIIASVEPLCGFLQLDHLRVIFCLFLFLLTVNPSYLLLLMPWSFLLYSGHYKWYIAVWKVNLSLIKFLTGTCDFIQSGFAFTRAGVFWFCP